MHFGIYVNVGPQLLVGNGPAVETEQNRRLDWYHRFHSFYVIMIHLINFVRRYFQQISMARNRCTDISVEHVTGCLDSME